MTCADNHTSPSKLKAADGVRGGLENDYEFLVPTPVLHAASEVLTGVLEVLPALQKMT